MTENQQNSKARLLNSYHKAGDPLVLPNAWDALSAAVVVRAGAKAVATASAAVSWSLGSSDGQGLTREEMMLAVERVCRAVDVPVTADVEGGYGPSSEDVSVSVKQAVAAGAVGINLEDSPGEDEPLLAAGTQAQRVRAARETATAAGVPDLVINARTDVYLAEVGDPADRFDEALARAHAFADAGADCLFVPALLDVAAIEKLVDQAPLPISVLALPGGPSVAEFGKAGVCRISVGPGIARAAYSAAHEAASELLTEGTLSFADNELAGADIDSWMSR